MMGERERKKENEGIGEKEEEKFTTKIKEL